MNLDIIEKLLSNNSFSIYLISLVISIINIYYLYCLVSVRMKIDKIYYDDYNRCGLNLSRINIFRKYTIYFNKVLIFMYVVFLIEFLFCIKVNNEMELYFIINIFSTYSTIFLVYFFIMKQDIYLSITDLKKLKVDVNLISNLEHKGVMYFEYITHEKYCSNIFTTVVLMIPCILHLFFLSIDLEIIIYKYIHLVTCILISSLSYYEVKLKLKIHEKTLNILKL